MPPTAFLCSPSVWDSSIKHCRKINIINDSLRIWKRHFTQKKRKKLFDFCNLSAKKIRTKSFIFPQWTRKKQDTWMTCSNHSRPIWLPQVICRDFIKINAWHSAYDFINKTEVNSTDFCLLFFLKSSKSAAGTLKLISYNIYKLKGGWSHYGYVVRCATQPTSCEPGSSARDNSI